MTDATMAKPRGRPKGSKNKPKDAAASVAEKPKTERAASATKPKEAASKPPKSEAPRKPTAPEQRVSPVEDLNDDQHFARFLQNVRRVDEVEATQQAVIKDAKAKIAAARDQARAECGKSFMHERKFYADFQKPDGQSALKTLIEMQVRVARWADLPVGTIEDLFGEDRTPIHDKVFRDGKKAGMAGLSNEAPGTLDGKAKSKWTEGWHAGQAVNLEQLGKMKKPDEPAFDAHAPKEEPAAPAQAPVDYFAAGGLAASHGLKAEPPAGLAAEHEANWVDGFNAYKPAAPAPIDWEKQGARAYEANEPFSVPDAVPNHEQGSWRTGYTKARSADLESKREQMSKQPAGASASPPTDYRQAGAEAFARGEGGVVPLAVPEEHSEAWLDGWDTASVEHAKANPNHAQG